jgi:hypothetical protein
MFYKFSTITCCAVFMLFALTVAAGVSSRPAANNE